MYAGLLCLAGADLEAVGQWPKTATMDLASESGSWRFGLRRLIVAWFSERRKEELDSSCASLAEDRRDRSHRATVYCIRRQPSSRYPMLLQTDRRRAAVICHLRSTCSMPAPKPTQPGLPVSAWCVWERDIASRARLAIACRCSACWHRPDPDMTSSPAVTRRPRRSLFVDLQSDRDVLNAAASWASRQRWISDPVADRRSLIEIAWPATNVMRSCRLQGVRRYYDAGQRDGAALALPTRERSLASTPALLHRSRLIWVLQVFGPDLPLMASPASRRPRRSRCTPLRRTCTRNLARWAIGGGASPSPPFSSRFACFLSPFPSLFFPSPFSYASPAVAVLRPYFRLQRRWSRYCDARVALPPAAGAGRARARRAASGGRLVAGSYDLPFLDVSLRSRPRGSFGAAPFSLPSGGPRAETTPNVGGPPGRDLCGDLLPVIAHAV